MKKIKRQTIQHVINSTGGTPEGQAFNTELMQTQGVLVRYLDLEQGQPSLKNAREKDHPIKYFTIWVWRHEHGCYPSNIPAACIALDLEIVDEARWMEEMLNRYKVSQPDFIRMAAVMIKQLESIGAASPTAFYSALRVLRLLELADGTS